MYNLQAERALLSRGINDPKISQVIDVKTDDFYSENHQRVWKIVQHVAAQQKDSVIVECREVDPDIDLKLLTDLADDTTPYDVKDLNDKIMDLSLRRQVRSLLKAADDRLPNESGANVIEGLLKDLGEFAGGEAGGIPLHEIIHKVADDLKNQRPEQYLETMHDIDFILGGLRPGGLYIVGGLPGMGKSAFALWLARQCAENGAAVDFWSLEMLARSLGKRYISGALQTSELSVEDIPDIRQLYDAARKYKAFNIFEQSRVQPVDIAKECRRKMPDVVVVDYLQRLRPPRHAERRDLDVAQIAAELKEIALEFHIPVVALSSVNRECMKRKDKRPILSDLRESGAIDFEADTVVFVHRESYFGDNPDVAGPLEIIVRKNRDYKLGTVTIHYNPANSHFKQFSRMGLP